MAEKKVVSKKETQTKYRADFKSWDEYFKYKGKKG